jgi:hypothetical protein
VRCSSAERVFAAGGAAGLDPACGRPAAERRASFLRLDRSACHPSKASVAGRGNAAGPPGLRKLGHREYRRSDCAHTKLQGHGSDCAHGGHAASQASFPKGTPEVAEAGERSEPRRGRPGIIDRLTEEEYAQLVADGALLTGYGSTEYVDQEQRERTTNFCRCRRFYQGAANQPIGRFSLVNDPTTSTRT